MVPVLPSPSESSVTPGFLLLSLDQHPKPTAQTINHRLTALRNLYRFHFVEETQGGHDDEDGTGSQLLCAADELGKIRTVSEERWRTQDSTFSRKALCSAPGSPPTWGVRAPEFLDQATS
jgi:hypothetical protein